MYIVEFGHFPLPFGDFVRVVAAKFEVQASLDLPGISNLLR